MKKATYKVIKGLVIVVLILGVFRIMVKVDRTYTRQATVVSVENNVIMFEDTTGNVWEWVDKGYKYNVGDQVRMMMDNNSTIDVIEDDEIVKITLDK